MREYVSVWNMIMSTVAVKDKSFMFHLEWHKLKIFIDKYLEFLVFSYFQRITEKSHALLVMSPPLYGKFR